ncbi:MAG: SCP-2 sterol transfer family protein [Gammaproteobacteria bacterium]|nr:SCP-2 sterol transfer family protein [Gammaproteobacteria bacterium]
MAEIFSKEWMAKYKSLWNTDADHVKQLADSGFTSNVGFGMAGEDDPRIVIEIQHGVITKLEPYIGQSLDWDVRGKPAFWLEITKKAPNIMKIGLAYTSRDLKFVKGDYAAMIKEPRLSNAFIKCFKFMSLVYTAS